MGGMIYLGWAKGGPPVTSTLLAYVGASTIKSPDNGVCYSDRCLGSNAAACCQRSKQKSCQIKDRPLSPQESASCSLTCCLQDERTYEWTCDDGKPSSECYPA